MISRPPHDNSINAVYKISIAVTAFNIAVLPSQSTLPSVSAIYPSRLMAINKTIFRIFNLPFHIRLQGMLLPPAKYLS